MGNRLERLFRADPDVVRHAVRVSVWGRWYIWLVGAVMLAHRPGLWYPEYLGFGVLNVSLPATTDCTAQGSVCTQDRRPLSQRLQVTVPGPGG